MMYYNVFPFDIAEFWRNPVLRKVRTLYYEKYVPVGVGSMFRVSSARMYCRYRYHASIIHRQINERKYEKQKIWRRALVT